MAHYTYIRPIDQPTGAFRLLDWMEHNFRSGDYEDFRCLVAFAKIKPFYKLHDSIQLWNSLGKTSEAVIGVDHKGTSLQALQYALANFDCVNILHAGYSTFHPKLYIFSGPSKASVYYGSSNFTSGGLETNFEGGIIADFSFPADQNEFDDLYKSYTCVTAPAAACMTRLTAAFLDSLNTQGFLLDETQKAKSPRSPAPAAGAGPSSGAAAPAPLFGGISIKPARPIPKSIMVSAASSAGIALAAVKVPGKKSASTSKPTARTSSPSTAAPVQVVVPVIANELVIQVAPHDNGEILLSMVAVNQNPAFFKFPFTGTSVPKKAGNPPYPQRVPDPVVNIRVYDGTGTLANVANSYPLNTVYYEAKSELRVTITPAILSALNVSAVTTNYPILVMRASSATGCDYELDFFASGSAAYNGYLAVCNQSLPTGGKPPARKMGWI